MRVFTVRALRRDAPADVTPEQADPGHMVSPKTAIIREEQERFLVESKDFRRVRLPLYNEPIAGPPEQAPAASTPEGTTSVEAPAPIGTHAQPPAEIKPAAAPEADGIVKAPAETTGASVVTEQAELPILPEGVSSELAGAAGGAALIIAGALANLAAEAEKQKVRDALDQEWPAIGGNTRSSYQWIPPRRAPAEKPGGLNSKELGKRSERANERIRNMQAQVDRLLSDKSRSQPFVLDAHQLDAPRADASSAQISIRDFRLADALASLRSAEHLLRNVRNALDAYEMGDRSFDPTESTVP